jgi:hypothetical protein
MGVRGFITHIRSNVHDVGKQHDLKSLPGCKTIVVDGNAFAYWIYFRQLQNWSCNYVKISKHLERVLNDFSRAGITLIFVFDGPTEHLKLRSKLDRLSKQAFVCTKCPQTFSDTIYPPILMIECIKNVLIRYSASEASHSFFFSVGEADRDLVATSSEFDALGVLSNDSDMLVYKYCGDVDFIPLWSLNCDINGMTAHAVHRCLFAKSLNISPQVVSLL